MSGADAASSGADGLPDPLADPEPRPDPVVQSSTAASPVDADQPWRAAAAAPAPGIPAAASAPGAAAASVVPPVAAPEVARDAADLARAATDPGLPGVHRGGFSRLPTQPVGIGAPAVGLETGDIVAEWMLPPAVAPQRGLAGWALAFAIGGLVFSLFVGWAFPIALVGVVSAILALRRPFESRGLAAWALALGLLAVLYSAGWLLWAALQAGSSG